MWGIFTILIEEELESINNWPDIPYALQLNLNLLVIIYNLIFVWQSIENISKGK